MHEVEANSGGPLWRLVCSGVSRTHVVSQVLMPELLRVMMMKSLWGVPPMDPLVAYRVTHSALVSDVQDVSAMEGDLQQVRRDLPFGSKCLGFRLHNRPIIREVPKSYKRSGQRDGEL